MKKVNMTNLSNKLTRIYGDECEKNVVGIIIYENNGEYFFDKEFKYIMNNEELEALLLRGAVIEKDGVFYSPASFNNEGVSFSAGGGYDEYITEAKIMSIVLGNYQIKYNSTNDTLDFLYNGVIEEPIIDGYVSEGLLLYINASDVTTYGSIRDLTGNQTITNNGVSTTLDNDCLNFVRSESDYIDCGFKPNLTQWSAEFYFYFTASPTSPETILGWGSSGNRTTIACWDGNFIIAINSDATHKITSTPPTSLTHIILTYNNGTIIAYVNGVKSQLTTSAEKMSSQQSNLMLGTKYNYSGEFGNIHLKSLRFYDGKVLSDEEALQNYNYETKNS